MCVALCGQPVVGIVGVGGGRVSDHLADDISAVTEVMGRGQATERGRRWYINTHYRPLCVPVCGTNHPLCDYT